MGTSLKLKKQQEGFTIIEVMIVLVIAAVILLIVFLAVPALQRNSRNTQVKNEAAQLTAATSEWSSNNNGKVPTVTADANAIQGLTKNRTLTTLTLKAGAQAGVQPASQADAVLVTGAACGTQTGLKYSTTAGSTRQIALVYLSENPTLGASCTDSGL